MTRLLIDTSVLIKWFHSPGESELVEARALREAHRVGEVEAHILDLALYDTGNVLIRALGWSAREVADQIDDLLKICGPPLQLAGQGLADAALLATQHRLSFYDATWAAAARGLSIPLVSADRRLVAAGLAESPTMTAERLRLLKNG